jgi:hypothetical protein
MRYMKPLIILITVLFAFGCKEQKAGNAVLAPEEAPQQPASVAPEGLAGASNENNLTEAQALEKKFSKGMSYQDLRNNALGEAWLPLKNFQCKENVGGEARICAERPELESCSGDGHCNMWFAHGPSNTRLKVGTYADQVKFWEFSSLPADENATACPSEKFEEFLKTFSTDKSVQKAFTTPLLKVEELYGADLETRLTYVKQSDYEDYDLAYAKDGYHVIDGSEKMDPKPVDVQVIQEAPDTYYVKYLYGSSEGNSYRFKKPSGCWHLAEDPDAPSP